MLCFLSYNIIIITYVSIYKQGTLAVITYSFKSVPLNPLAFLASLSPPSPPRPTCKELEGGSAIIRRAEKYAKSARSPPPIYLALNVDS